MRTYSLQLGGLNEKLQGVVVIKQFTIDIKKCHHLILRHILLFILVFHSCLVLAINDQLKLLINYETLANSAASRSNDTHLIPHLEIPIEYLYTDFAKRLNPKIRESLVFERDQKQYVRWILNPEDTKWGTELIEHLNQKYSLQMKKKYHFYGYQTASRSYIVEDPRNGARFSVKSSTNVTAGIWKDKKQPVGEALDSRLLSDFLFRQNQMKTFQNIIVMDEPAIMSNTVIDQAVVIRDLGDIQMDESRFYYLPGFSALHEKTGIRLARLNGSHDPYDYWTEHYIKPVGRALGELAARTGLQLDSPHSQNFLIELDLKWKPTGRIVIRDLADLYVDRNFMYAIEGLNSPVLKQMTQISNIKDQIYAGFGPLHGNIYPTWVDSVQYELWKSVFFNEFERAFKLEAEFDLNQLKASQNLNGDYFSARYDLRGNDLFFQKLRAKNRSVRLEAESQGLKCSRVLSRFGSLIEGL